MNKKLKSTRSSKTLKETKDNDFPFRLSSQSRSKSIPRHVRFAEKPLYPESDPEDSIILRNQIQMRSSQIPQPILKDTEYIPPKPSYLRLLRRRIIRKARKNSQKILRIALFLFFAFLLFEIMFCWGEYDNQFQNRRKKEINFFQSNDFKQKDFESHLYVGNNLQSKIYSIDNKFEGNTLFNIHTTVLASFVTIFILITLYFLFC